MNAKYWLNGAFRETSAAIDIADRGFLLGDGAFETILVAQGRPAFLDAHLARLRRGLAALEIPAPAALDEFAAIIAALARENGLAEGPASARITVTRGPGGRGRAFPARSAPTMLISLAPAPASSSSPLRLLRSARRRYSRALGADFKAIAGYLDNMLAFNEARRAGADEALILNEHGRIVSAARANLFVFRKDGRIATPAACEGALPGVVRGLLLDGGHGVEIEEAAIEPDELAGARLFVANSLLGIVPAFLGDDPRPPAPAGGDLLDHLQTWYQQRLQRSLAGERRSRESL